MIFSSVFFLYVFLPVTLALYYIVPWKLKNAVLLLVSMIFYAWGEPVYVFLMSFSILFNYLSGLEISSFQDHGQDGAARFSFVFTVIVNLGILGFFKYYGFFLDIVNSILPFHIEYKALALPIGISFYTFQTLSYIIDVYRGEIKVQKNILSFGAYVTMFPQLIAGPIVQYSDVEQQLANRELSWIHFGEGVTWFLRGLGKKVLFANNIGSVSDAILAMPASERSVLTAWLGIIAYTFQLYYDFSGYSDMAIGLGKMLGFDFMKNFDYPYISKSISEFWRRWHISLGSWFREYVYIPLGGNRCSKRKHIRNMLIVWGLTGLWHGAMWNFIVWGLWFGILQILERYTLREVFERLPDWALRIYTILMVIISWVFFSTPNMGAAFAFLGDMFGIGAKGFADSIFLYYFGSSIFLMIIMGFCATPIVYKMFRRFAISNGRYKTVKVTIIYACILLLSTAYLVNATYNPFMYFRF